MDIRIASHLEDAPWPATKDELIDTLFVRCTCEVIENLQLLRTLVSHMKISKKVGPTIQQKTIASSMKMNTKNKNAFFIKAFFIENIPLVFGDTSVWCIPISSEFFIPWF